MIGYERVPDGYDFNTEFDTWIIAYCPDEVSWFLTNHRFFFYEYGEVDYKGEYHLKEFKTIEDAIWYFVCYKKIFFQREKELLGEEFEFRPSFAKNKVFLDFYVDDELKTYEFEVDENEDK